jgi:hypothetical protein
VIVATATGEEDCEGQQARAKHLLAHLRVFADEAAQGGVLVADAPPLIDNNAHERNHYHNDGSCEGYGKDEIYF